MNGLAKSGSVLLTLILVISFGGCPPAQTNGPSDDTQGANEPPDDTENTAIEANSGSAPADNAGNVLSYVPNEVWDLYHGLTGEGPTDNVFNSETSGGANNDSDDDGGAGDGDGDSDGQSGSGTGLVNDDAFPFNHVDAFVYELVCAGAAFTVCSTMADAQISWESLDTAIFGTCPETAYAGGQMYGLVSVDYPDAGCTSGNTGWHRYYGGWAGWLLLATGQAHTEFLAAQLNGRAVEGGFDGQMLPNAGSLLMNGVWQIDSGSAYTYGDISVVYVQTGRFSVTLDDAFLGAYTVQAGNLGIEPHTYRNYMADSGTARFLVHDYDNNTDVELAVSFSTQSPVTGAVLVSIDDGAPVTYNTPFFSR